MGVDIGCGGARPQMAARALGRRRKGTMREKEISRRGNHVTSVADLGAEGEVGAAEVLGHHRRADQQEHRDDDEALDPADLRAAEHPHPVELGGAVAQLRLGEADEVADAVVFLASERAAYITGQVLSLDGGGIKAL